MRELTAYERMTGAARLLWLYFHRTARAALTLAVAVGALSCQPQSAAEIQAARASHAARLQTLADDESDRLRSVQSLIQDPSVSEADLDKALADLTETRKALRLGHFHQEELAADLWLANNAAQRTRRLPTVLGQGLVTATAVGPGFRTGSELVYTAVTYLGGPFELVATDVAKGRSYVFPCPVKTETRVWSMQAGGDGRLYIVTAGEAHLLRFDPKACVLEDLGRPSAKETDLMGLVLDPGGKVYVSSFPGCRVFRFDPASRSFQDLGPADSQPYGRTMAGTDDGRLLVGTGSQKQGIVLFDPETREARQLLPESKRIPGFALVFRDENGSLLASVISPTGRTAWKLEGDRLVEQPGKAPGEPLPALRGGLRIKVESGEVTLTEPGQPGRKVPIDMTRAPLPIFRYGGSDQAGVVASTVLPANLVSLDQATGAWTARGSLGAGEAYSFLPLGAHRLALGGYSTSAGLMIADLGQPLATLTPGDGYRTQSSWRPTALTQTDAGTVFAAGYPGYGVAESFLIRWDVESNLSKTYRAVSPGFSVVSVAALGGRLALGTSVRLGQGVKFAESKGQVLIWDVGQERVTDQFTVLEGQVAVDNLVFTPSGLILGAGRNEAGGGAARVFTLDPGTGEVSVLSTPDVGALLYGTLAPGRTGEYWAVAENGVVRIDLARMRGELVSRSNGKVTAAGAFVKGAIYYSCGPMSYRYALPSD